MQRYCARLFSTLMLVGALASLSAFAESLHNRAGFGWIPFGEEGTRRDRVEDHFIAGKRQRIQELATGKVCRTGSAFRIPSENFDIAQFSFADEEKGPFIDRLGPGIQAALKKIATQKDPEFYLFLESHGQARCLWSQEDDDTKTYSYDFVFAKVFQEFENFYEQHGFLPRVKIFNGACQSGSAIAAFSAALEVFIRKQRDNRQHPLRERPDMTFFYGAAPELVSNMADMQDSLDEIYHPEDPAARAKSDVEALAKFCRFVNRNPQAIWSSRHQTQKAVLRELLLAETQPKQSWPLASFLVVDFGRNTDLFLQLVMEEKNFSKREKMLKQMLELYEGRNSPKMSDPLIDIQYLLAKEMAASAEPRRSEIAALVVLVRNGIFTGDGQRHRFQADWMRELQKELAQLGPELSEQTAQAVKLMEAPIEAYIDQFSKLSPERQARKYAPDYKDKF